MRVDLVGFPILVLAASVAVLGGALVSQYWGGLVPCELCVLQRWPWVASIVISTVAIVVDCRPALPWIGLTLAAVFAVGSAFAFYHVGVEQHWFAGPGACTGAATAADTVEALKVRILGQMPVRCDEPAWSLWGISLAGWNFLASLVLVASCLVVFWRRRRPLRRGAMRQGIA